MKTKLQKIIDDLAKWREERNLTQEGQRAVFLKNTQEECEELDNAETEEDCVDAICDLVIVALNAFEIDLDKLPLDGERYHSTLSINQTAEVMFHHGFHVEEHIVKLLNMLRKAGYDPIICLEETIKEISSRRQDPKQKEEWDRLRSEGKKPIDKWQKDKNQTDTYKADYSRAKYIKFSDS